MPRGELSWDEEEGARIVARFMGGAYRARDVPGAEEGAHDADVVLPDGRRVAVEVTSAGDPELESLYAAGFGTEWRAPTLAYSWWLVLPQDPDLKLTRLIAAAEPQLAVLERHGLEQTGGGSRERQPPPGAHEEAAEASRRLFALGVRVARRLSPPGSGETAQILVSFGGGTGSRFDELNALVAERAGAKVDKLMAADADERHLFVWIRGSQSGAELTMATLPPPETAPSLPSGIDVVWVSTAGVLRRVRSPGRWEEMGSPTVGGGA